MARLYLIPPARKRFSTVIEGKGKCHSNFPAEKPAKKKTCFYRLQEIRLRRLAVRKMIGLHPAKAASAECKTFCFHFNRSCTPQFTTQLPPPPGVSGKACVAAALIMPNHSNSEYKQFPLPSIPINSLSSPSAFFTTIPARSHFSLVVASYKYSYSVKAVPLTAYSLLASQVNTNNYIYNAALPSNRRAVRQPDLGPRSQRDQRPPCLRCKSSPSRARAQAHEQNVLTTSENTENMHQQHAGTSLQPGMRPQ